MAYKEETMSEHITEEKLHEISRRAFLFRSAKTAAGVAVAGTALGMLVPNTSFAANTEPFEYTFAEKSADSMPHPLPYPGLDPLKAQERAYKAYQEKGG